MVTKSYIFWTWKDIHVISVYLSWISIGNLQVLHQHILICILFYLSLSRYSVFWSKCLSNNIHIVDLVCPMLSVAVSYINLFNNPLVSIQNLILLLFLLSMFIHKAPKVYPFLSGVLSIHIRWFNLLYPLISSKDTFWLSAHAAGHRRRRRIFKG